MPPLKLIPSTRPTIIQPPENVWMAQHNAEIPEDAAWFCAAADLVGVYIGKKKIYLVDNSITNRQVWYRIEREETADGDPAGSRTDAVRDQDPTGQSPNPA